MPAADVTHSGAQPWGPCGSRGVPVCRTLLAQRMTAGGRCNGKRILQLEVDHRFRLQDDLLALGCGRNAGSGARSRNATNGRPLAAAKNTTQDCAHGGASANLGLRSLASSASGMAPLVGLETVAFAIHYQARQLQGQY